MRVYLARWVCESVESNVAHLIELSAFAAGAGAELVVFPESFLHGYTRSVEPRRVRALFAEISARHAAPAFVFGSFSEGGANRMTVWQEGRQLAAYDKVHLFAPNGERDLWQPGNRYVAVKVLGRTLGLLNCNDLRFPEQARALRLRARCDLFVVVGWWPWRRDHVWQTLLQARAIENGVWVVGCCVAASEFAGERFAGAGNYVFDPHGEPVRTSDDVLYELDFGGVLPLLVDPVADAREIGEVIVFE